MAEIDFQPNASSSGEIDFQPTHNRSRSDSNSYLSALTNALAGVAHPFMHPMEGLHTLENIGQQIFSDPGSAARGTFAGLAQGSDDIVNNIANLFGLHPNLQYQSADLNTPIGNIAREALPLTIGGGVGGLAEKGALKALEAAPEFMGKKLATILGKGAAGGAAAGVPMGVNPVQGAELGATFGVPGILAPESRLSEEELSRKQAAIPEGINAPTGPLLDSPALKALYGLSEITPGSGAKRPYRQLHNYYKEAMQNVAPTEGRPGNEEVFNAINNGYQAAKMRTNSAYEHAKNVAEKANLKLDKVPLQQAINSLKDDLKDELSTPTGAAVNQPTVNMLHELDDAKNLDTYKSGEGLRKVLNVLLERAGRNDSAVPQVRHLSILKKGLDDTLEKTAAKNPEVDQAYKTARQARQLQGQFEKQGQRRTPFYDYYFRKASPDRLISRLAPRSRKQDVDQASILSSFMPHLSDADQQTVREGLLNTDNLNDLSRQLKSLSPRQKEIISGPHHSLVKNFEEAVKTYPKMLSPEFEPQTGYYGEKARQAHHNLREAGRAALGSGAGYAGAHAIGINPLLGLGSWAALGPLTQYLVRRPSLVNLARRNINRVSPSRTAGRTVAIKEAKDGS